MSAARIKEIIKEVNSAFEKNNPEVFLGYCTDDIRWEMAGDEARTGKEAIREFMASTGDMKLTSLNVTDIIAEGDRAACFGDMEMDEKGNSTAYTYCDVYKFKGEKIAELRSFVAKNKAEGEKDQAASA